MALLWTDPREWATEDTISKDRLNDISNDLSYLMNPSRKIITNRGTGSNVNITSTTLVDLDAALFSLSVELTGKRAVRVKFQGTWSNTVLGAFSYIDVLIDNSIYLSSLTGTQVSTNVRFTQQPVANYYLPVEFDVLIPAGGLAAGTHTFKPQVRVTSGTLTFYESGIFAQFSVGE